MQVVTAAGDREEWLGVEMPADTAQRRAILQEKLQEAIRRTQPR
jgi:hypothetical protein